MKGMSRTMTLREYFKSIDKINTIGNSINPMFQNIRMYNSNCKGSAKTYKEMINAVQTYFVSSNIILKSEVEIASIGLSGTFFKTEVTVEYEFDGKILIETFTFEN